ncbi:putative diphthamide synthesis protein-domain-containing protein [Flagelloscypha sp. PMI_526]|nr:putative diphthamide synthesis protein-domain-containing protein [Flagelloscypha sp. PMI_526]
MSLFSSSESSAISRSTDVSNEDSSLHYVQPYTSHFNDYFDIEDTATKILGGNFKRVALQFPDSLLRYSVPIYQSLKAHMTNHRIGSEIPELYVLADTSYGSCCVDEVAAQHVDADAMIHYGHACLSQQSRLPVIYVFPKQDLDIEDCETGKTGNVTLKCDVSFAHVIGKVFALVQDVLSGTQVLFEETLRMTTPAVGRPSQASRARNITSESVADTIFYVGSPGPTLNYILLSNPLAQVHAYAPNSPRQSPDDLRSINNKFLMRRYAAIQKARDSDVFGLLVGTLGVASYLPLLTDLRSRIRARHKKSYTVSVGKLTPSKLGNFMEVECWVVVACREGSIGSLGDKDYQKPIVTPYELLHALTPPEIASWTGGYELEFGKIIEQERPNDDSDDEEPQFSLTTGQYRHAKKYIDPSSYGKGKKTEARTPSDGALIQRNSNDAIVQFQASSAAAQFLQSREYQGLDPTAGSADGPSKLEQGRKGVAKGYGEAST